MFQDEGERIAYRPLPLAGGAASGRLLQIPSPGSSAIGAAGHMSGSANTADLAAISQRSSTPAPVPLSRIQAAQTYGQVPLSFQPNVGQAGAGVQFLYQGTGYAVALNHGNAILSLQTVSADSAPTTLTMNLIGSAASAHAVGLNPLTAHVNYLLGNDPSQWRTGIATYGRVEYQQVYPGIDMVYYGNHGQLEYDFQVQPGTDPTAIGLSFGGVQNLSIDSQGNLVLQTSAGAIQQHRPVLYQDIDGVRHDVSGSFILGGNDVRFAVGAYDPTRTLVIDPQWVYSTYLGGSGTEDSFGAAVDSQGDLFVTGQTTSVDFPSTSGSFQTLTDGNAHAYVAEFDPTGQTLIYATYFGGNNQDRADAIALGSDGSAYIAGRTSSRNLPVTPNAFGTVYPGGAFSAFVARLTPDGSGLIFSTYLGGSNNDSAFGIAVDAAGNADVTGGTSSEDFPVTPSAFDYDSSVTTPFFSQFSPDGTNLNYSTFLGGSFGRQRANGIAVDASGDVYITGQTSSPDLPTTISPSAQPDLGANGSAENAFVAKFDPSAFGDASLIYCTYLGGSVDDIGLGIAVDGNGDAFVTGIASSADFPVQNAIQPTMGNGALSNAFITEVSPAGDRFLFSTFFGGTGTDRGSAIALDASNNIYITGYTISADFPTVNPVQAHLNGFSDAFVTVISADLSGPVFSTYLGGSGDENDQFVTIYHEGGIAVDNSGGIYVVGSTSSADFPTTNPLQPGLNGFTNAFAVKLQQ